MSWECATSIADPWSNHQIGRSFYDDIGFLTWQLCSIISVAVLPPLQLYQHHLILMFCTTFRPHFCSYIYLFPLSSSCSRFSLLSFVPLLSFCTTSPSILLCLFLIFPFILLLLFFSASHSSPQSCHIAPFHFSPLHYPTNDNCAFRV
jgi:hypothetical protein